MSKNSKRREISLGENAKIWKDRKFLEQWGASFSYDEKNSLPGKNRYNFSYPAKVFFAYAFKYWEKLTDSIDCKQKFTTEIKNIQNVSIVIGKEAYGDLTRAMLYAEKEIKIIAPFISSENLIFCSKLLEKNPNLKIELLTSVDKNDIKPSFMEILGKEDRENEVLKKETQDSIIKKLKRIEEQKKRKEKKNIHIQEIRDYITQKIKNSKQVLSIQKNIIGFLFLCLIYILFFRIKNYPVLSHNKLLITGVLSFIYFLIMLKINKKIKDFSDKNKIEELFFKERKQIYDLIIEIDEITKQEQLYQQEIGQLEKKNFTYFTYSNKYKNFDFKVVNKGKSEETGKNYTTYPHVKMYLVDDIVYLGSLNFSTTSFINTIESIIKIEDKNAVVQLKEYFNSLYNHSDLEFINQEELGKLLYELRGENNF